MSKTISPDKAGSKKAQPLLGIYEARLTPVSLGGLLTFIAELQTQCFLHKMDQADLCFTGGGNPLAKESIFLPLFENFKGIHDVLYKDSVDQLLESTVISHRVTWPDIWGSNPFPYTYDSTLVIQRIFQEHHFVPHLSLRPPALEWAAKFIKRHAPKAKAIAVHLKNNPDKPNESNANFPAWEKFFIRCQDKYPVKFILVGNEKIPVTIKRLDNVVVAQDLKSNLLRDLALIQQADAFLGMSSGPCNMAIFNTKPYVIFKNPTHHKEEMQKELGESEKFNFASPMQKFLRVRETDQRLLTEFEAVYKKLEQGK